MEENQHWLVVETVLKNVGYYLNEVKQHKLIREVDLARDSLKLAKKEHDTLVMASQTWHRGEKKGHKPVNFVT